MEGSPIYGEVELTASGTATLFAAPGAGYRNHVTKGFISVASGVAAAQVRILEIAAGGSSTVNQTWEVPRATSGFYPFDFGDHGVPAASTNTRFVAQVTGADAPATFVFTGYKR